MTEAQRSVIAQPATGLMIYQTNGESGFWYYDGTMWSSLNNSSGNSDNDTDQQTLSITNNQLQLSLGVSGGGGSVDMNPYLDNIDTDDQSLIWDSSTSKLSIENGNEIDMSALSISKDSISMIIDHDKDTYVDVSNNYVNITTGGRGLRFRNGLIEPSQIGGGAFFGVGLGASSTIHSSSNSFFGNDSGMSHKDGKENSFFGKGAGEGHENGDGNCFIGASSGLIDKVSFYNTYVGADAGKYLDGFGCTLLGYDAHGIVGIPLQNSIAIGYEALVTDNNQVRIGNSNASSIGGQVSWTSLSDGRFKRNFSKDNLPGLKFITGLIPLSYDLASSRNEVVETEHKVSHLFRFNNERHVGFIAQEVERLVKRLGVDFHGVDIPKNKHGNYELRYSAFVIPLVKAIQEQQEIIELMRMRFKKEVEQLQIQMQIIRSRIDIDRNIDID